MLPVTLTKFFVTPIITWHLITLFFDLRGCQATTSFLSHSSWGTVVPRPVGQTEPQARRAAWQRESSDNPQCVFFARAKHFWCYLFTCGSVWRGSSGRPNSEEFPSVLGSDNLCRVNVIKPSGGRGRLKTPTDDAVGTPSPLALRRQSAKRRRERRPSVCVRLCVFTVVIVLTVRMETLPL